MAKAVIVIEYDYDESDDALPETLQQSWSDAISVIPGNRPGVERKYIYVAVAEDANKVLELFDHLRRGDDD